MPPCTLIIERAAKSSASPAAERAALAASGNSSGLDSPRPAGVVLQPAGVLQPAQDLGQLVLDRLVGADRAAEREPLLGVGDADVQARLHRADRLRRDQRLGEIPRVAERLGADLEPTAPGPARTSRAPATGWRRSASTGSIATPSAAPAPPPRPARRRSRPRLRPAGPRRGRRARTRPPRPARPPDHRSPPRGAAPRDNPERGSHGPARLVLARAAARRRTTGRSSPAATAGSDPSPAASRMAVAGSSPSSGTDASTRPHSSATSSASNAPSPAPPCSSPISRPGPPRLDRGRPQVGQRGGILERLASGLHGLPAATALPRAASRSSTCSSERAKFIPPPPPAPWRAAR